MRPGSVVPSSSSNSGANVGGHAASFGRGSPPTPSCNGNFFFLGKCLIFVHSPPLCDNVMQVEGGEGGMGKQRDWLGAAPCCNKRTPSSAWNIYHGTAASTRAPWKWKGGSWILVGKHCDSTEPWHSAINLLAGELMMSLLWYYRPEHTQGGRNPSMHQVSHPDAKLEAGARLYFCEKRGLAWGSSCMLGWPQT